MNFLQKARDLEAKLSGRFDRTAGTLVRSGNREPLEIVHAIVEAATLDGGVVEDARRFVRAAVPAAVLGAVAVRLRRIADAVGADGAVRRQDALVPDFGRARGHGGQEAGRGGEKERKSEQAHEFGAI